MSTVDDYVASLRSRDSTSNVVDTSQWRELPTSMVEAGWGAGKAGWQGGMGAIGGALGLDTESYVRQKQEEADFYARNAPGTTQFFGDRGVVSEGGSVADWLAYNLGQSAPYILESLAGAGAGGLALKTARGSAAANAAARGMGREAVGQQAARETLDRGLTAQIEREAVERAAGDVAARYAMGAGAAAASYPSAVGDILNNQLDAGAQFDDMNLGAAASGGLPYALLNLLGGEASIGRALTGGATRKAGLEGAEGYLKATLRGETLPGAIARGGARAGLMEGIGETGQELINQRFGRMVGNPDETFTGGDALHRYAESFMAGLGMGGIAGGGAAAFAKPVEATPDAIATRVEQMDRSVEQIFAGNETWREGFERSRREEEEFFKEREQQAEESRKEQERLHTEQVKEAQKRVDDDIKQVVSDEEQAVIDESAARQRDLDQAGVLRTIAQSGFIQPYMEVEPLTGGMNPYNLAGTVGTADAPFELVNPAPYTFDAMADGVQPYEAQFDTRNINDFITLGQQLGMLFQPALATGDTQTAGLLERLAQERIYDRVAEGFGTQHTNQMVAGKAGMPAVLGVQRELFGPRGGVAPEAKPFKPSKSTAQQERDAREAEGVQTVWTEAQDAGLTGDQLADIKSGVGTSIPSSELRDRLDQYRQQNQEAASDQPIETPAAAEVKTAESATSEPQTTETPAETPVETEAASSDVAFDVGQIKPSVLKKITGGKSAGFVLEPLHGDNLQVANAYEALKVLKEHTDAYTALIKALVECKTKNSGGKR